MENYHFKVEPITNCIKIIQFDEDGNSHTVLIHVSQYAALVKSVGLAADEIYQKEKEKKNG